MSGIQNLKTKKFRIFKFDHRAEIKNFYYFFGKAILVMNHDFEGAFSMYLDGKTRNNAAIVAPRNDYLKFSPHALVKNELFIFGGYSDPHKIATLKGCIWTEKPTRLINKFLYGSAALSVDDGKKAIICFDKVDYNKCEYFDGEFSTKTFSSYFCHWGGRLGFYQGNPTTVGDYNWNKVETLGSTGWTELTSFPERKIFSHVLMGLPNRSLLLAGGWYQSETAIWLLENDIWRKIGDLQHACSFSSAIMIENSIFIVPGYKIPYAIQRLDFKGDRLISIQVVGNSVYSAIPVLLEAHANYCA